MSEQIIYQSFSKEGSLGFYAVADDYTSDLVEKGLLKKATLIIGLLGVVLVIYSFLPSVWYTLQGGEKIAEILKRPVADFGKVLTVSQAAPKPLYQPQIDPNLSLENRIIIPKIGVDTAINESTNENYEEALRKGVWRVPDFSTPFLRQTSTILVAHRFGYLKWSNQFRRKNSFYNLTKLKEGDLVEVVWRQRKYKYQIYASSKGGEITDYQADLVLYTCENLNSSVRIFRYAKLLEI